MKDELGFNYAAHDRWVAKGNCPAVSWTKTWCSSRAGHQGRHRSPLVLPPGPGEIPGGPMLLGRSEPGARPSGVEYVEWDR